MRVTTKDFIAHLRHIGIPIHDNAPVEVVEQYLDRLVTDGLIMRDVDHCILLDKSGDVYVGKDEVG